MARSNNPPRVEWSRCVLPCSTVRYRLFVNGQESPYFVDRAATRAHFTGGQRVGLFGAGMGSGGIAGTLGSFDKVEQGKARAEYLALSDGLAVDLTDTGEQYVIPGAERDPKCGPDQGSLW